MLLLGMNEAIDLLIMKTVFVGMVICCAGRMVMCCAGRMVMC